jgi:ribonuclease-3
VALASFPAQDRLSERLGAREIPQELLREALTHASYVNESGENLSSNDRLEFLGDAFLGLVIADELARAFPEAGEGELTRMRADIVKGHTLAVVARRLGLGRDIILGRGEESAGGRARDRNLAGVFEAIVGAVLRAHGYRAARAWVKRVLAPELGEVKKRGVRIDPKSTLQHIVQAQWHEPPEYVTVEAESGESGQRFTVEVSAQGRVLGRGSGRSKREAQQEAAREAVERLAADGGDGG